MKLSTKILLAFAAVLLLSISDTTSNYLLSLKVEQNIAFLNRSQDIVRNSAKLHKTIIEKESSYRGYLLSKDPELLNGFTAGMKEAPELIEQERRLVKGSQKQMVILDRIESLFSEWVSYSDDVISSQELSPEKPRKDSRHDKLAQEKKGNIDEPLRREFLAFDRLEYKKRRMHSDNLMASIDNAHLLSMIFFSMTIAIGILSTAYIVYNISKRINKMVQLAGNISKGQFTKIEDKTGDEMTSLSNSLNLMSAKLKQNISALEKQNDELDKFAYVVSHDLKAPIRGIHNVVKWIEEDLQDELSPQLKKYLDIIPQRIKRMEDLINGLLAYARTREKTVIEQTNVEELVSEIIDTIVPRKVKVEMVNLPTLNTERLKLDQVFTNLISNAVKHIDPSKGVIKIGCERVGNHYEFSVGDNGRGIDKEYHTKIFEMFQTLREKNEEESTGIGLALVKKILYDLHCKIWVNSTLGKGAEFIFTWPLNQ
jgi:signal transduction histidine kinase